MTDASLTYLGTRLGDRTKVVDEISLGHTDTGIADGEDLVVLVGNDPDVQLPLSLEDRGLGQRCIANFVESIRSVGNQLSQEDFLVGVEGVCHKGVRRATKFSGETY